EGPARDFARRQRVFRPQADRLGGGARRGLCDRGSAHPAHPTATERPALPPVRLGSRDGFVPLSAPRLDPSSSLRCGSPPAAGRPRRTTAAVSTRSLPLPSPGHQPALAAAQSLAFLQRARRSRADRQATQRRLRLGPHPHPPLPGQRNLLSPLAAGLQPDELVQAALLAARVSDRNLANATAEDPAHGRATPTHRQPPSAGPARQRTTGACLEIRTQQNQQTQTLIPCFFTRDSGSNQRTRRTLYHRASSQVL